MRTPAAQTAGSARPRTAKLKTFPAPTSGWIANLNLLTPNALAANGQPVRGATVLENWFPTATGARMRGGSDLFATIGDEADSVVSIFSYLNGNAANLFAATSSAIYDITSPSAPGDAYLVDGAGNVLVDQNGDILLGAQSIPAGPDVDLLASGAWSTVQFSTPGGTFLVCVNGTDTPLIFDGTNWATTPAITGVDPTTLSYVFASKFRLWFIQKDTLNIYYLAPNAIGGAATLLPLGGIFTLGGALIYGGTWSIESGDGPSEQTIFVTTEGECAAYQGSDPSTDGSFVRQGVYRVGMPLGANSFVRTGGDLTIATNIGLVPLSAAFQRALAALAPVAVSYPIQIEWDATVAATVPDWQVTLWDAQQMIVVAPPTPEGNVPEIFVANVITGSWGLYTGWNVTCMTVFNNRLFFGSTLGQIVEGEVTGADQGNAYVCTVVPLFDQLKSPAALKTGLQSRVVLRAASAPNPQLSLQNDFVVSLPAAPDDTTVTASNTWGTGLWGTAQWGTTAVQETYEFWNSTPGAGYALSPGLQITSGNLSAPNVDLVQLDLLYDLGDVGT